MDKYIYRLIAYKDGEKIILAEYTEGDDGIYGFEIERVKGPCCSDDCCDGDDKCCQ